MAGKQVLGKVVVSNQGIRYELSEVIISNITTAGGVETVSFTYQKIEMQAAQAPDPVGGKEKAKQGMAEKHKPPTR